MKKPKSRLGPSLRVRVGRGVVKVSWLSFLSVYRLLLSLSFSFSPTGGCWG